MTNRGVFALLVVVALALGACGGSSGTTSPTSNSIPSPRPSSTAMLKIISPTNGEVIKGTTVRLLVDLKDATLVQATSTNLVPNEGHLHVILDDTLVSMTSGLETTLSSVAPGRHLIKVEFVANDHAPFDPRVITAVAFKTKAN